MGYRAKSARQDGAELTVQTFRLAFLGSLVNMERARNPGVNATVNLARWETFAIDHSVKYHASLGHAQMIQ